MHTHGKVGYTLVEVLVAAAIFLIVSVSIYKTYVGLFILLADSRANIAANDLANEQFEVVRNMSYSNVGIVNGVPYGVIPRSQTFVRDGYVFQSTTTVRNIVDPFTGAPANTADYKLVQFDMDCISCKKFTPVSFSGLVAPLGLYASSTNGSLFVRVLDANGDPVPEANIQLVNNSVSPAINILDETNNSGLYELVNTPTSTTGYQILVSKDGYSSDQTYPIGGNSVQNPNKPNATVTAEQLTDLTLSIDKTSTLNVSTVLPDCTPVPNVQYAISGTKTIGTDDHNRAVLKFATTTETTDSGGGSVLSRLEWDDYNINIIDPRYVLAGSISQLPVSLLPDSSQNLLLVMAPVSPKSVLFSIKDASTGLPITNANVTVVGHNSGYENTLITNQGSLSETDWSGGPGQNDMSDPTAFFASDGNIEYTAVPQQISLKNDLGSYSRSGKLISSTFDTGSSGNFYQLLWTPLNQPTQTGAPNVRFQLASNNDDVTWNFTGPDGTANTYYDTSDQNIASSTSGNRYLRYEVFLDTASTSYTPSIGNVSFTYTSACVPSGQVIFSGLTNDTYTYTVSKYGYETTTGTVILDQQAPNWQDQTVLLQS